MNDAFDRTMVDASRKYQAFIAAVRIATLIAVESAERRRLDALASGALLDLQLIVKQAAKD